MSCTKDRFWSGDTLHATTALHLVENSSSADRIAGSAIAVMREGPSITRARGLSAAEGSELRLRAFSLGLLEDVSMSYL